MNCTQVPCALSHTEIENFPQPRPRKRSAGAPNLYTFLLSKSLSDAQGSPSIGWNSIFRFDAFHGCESLGGLPATTGVGVMAFSWSNSANTSLQSSWSFFVSIEAERSE